MGKGGCQDPSRKHQQAVASVSRMLCLLGIMYETLDCSYILELDMDAHSHGLFHDLTQGIHLQPHLPISQQTVLCKTGFLPLVGLGLAHCPGERVIP